MTLNHDNLQFCLHWFEQQGWRVGKFGEADVLARAKGTSVAGLQRSRRCGQRPREVQLLKWTELLTDWAPELVINPYPGMGADCIS